MNDELLRRLGAGELHVAGVLSGTSADGIDVALCRVTFDGRRLLAIEAAAFATEPFEDALGARVRAVLEGAPVGLRDAALLHRDLGRAFGAAARDVARRHGLALGLVASHGQTVWHHDGVEPSGPATLQLGDGCEVAEVAGCATVSDFRARDVAAGGEGAPLSALADPVVFVAAPRPTLVLNLGGIANLTWIDAAGDVIAFDVGPANALLDGLARRLLAQPFDADGRAAARGTAAAPLVEEILAHPFLAARPPKSTGRDTFGAAWLDGVARAAAALGLGAEDALASAAVAVARAVAHDRAQRLPALARELPLLVAGGGVHHRPLMAALSRECGRDARSSATVGVPPDAREALVFAALGARCLSGEPSTAPGATGARPGRVLGKLSRAGADG